MATMLLLLLRLLDQDLIDHFSEVDVKEIKRFEQITDHDVKAVEYFLKQKCQSNAEIAKQASPTTLGKEMAIFVVRLSRGRKELSQIELLGKFSGAVNYNTHISAYPDVKWPDIAQEFVLSLGLCFNPYFAQHLHMIKMYLPTIKKRGYVTGLKKFWHDTEHFFLTSNLQDRLRSPRLVRWP